VRRRTLERTAVDGVSFRIEPGEIGRGSPWLVRGRVPPAATLGGSHLLWRVAPRRYESASS